MSSIGKILVVVNLILSGLVLGAAATLLSRGEVTLKDVTDAKAAVKAAETARTEAEAQYTERERALKDENTRLEADKSDLEVARGNADNKAQRLEVDNQQLRDDITKINAKLDTLESSLTSTMQRNQELTEQNGSLREEAITAKSAQAQAEQGRRDLEDSAAEAKRKVQELEDQLSTMEEAAKAGVGSGSGGATAAMPHIEARVKEVHVEEGFVVLDKGSDQSVQRGFTFAVTRDGNYIGRVKADIIFQNYVTALIEEQAPNARLQQGDTATTKAQ